MMALLQGVGDALKHFFIFFRVGLLDLFRLSDIILEVATQVLPCLQTF